MTYYEYGNQSDPTVILFQSRKTPDLTRLSEHYHVIIPLLDAESGKEAAEELMNLIQEEYHGEVFAIGVTNCHWKEAQPLFQKKDLSAKKIIVESDETIPGRLIADILGQTVQQRAFAG